MMPGLWNLFWFSDDSGTFRLFHWPSWPLVMNLLKMDAIYVTFPWLGVVFSTNCVFAFVHPSLATVSLFGHCLINIHPASWSCSLFGGQSLYLVPLHCSLPPWGPPTIQLQISDTEAVLYRCCPSYGYIIMAVIWALMSLHRPLVTHNTSNIPPHSKLPGYPTLGWILWFHDEQPDE